MSPGIKRKRTKALSLGNVVIGGGAPIVVQSMTCTDTRDVTATIAQINALAGRGCEVVRVAVPDQAAAAALAKIKEAISIPLVADIHFQHRLALAAIKAGVDGVRINPGNMKRDGVRQVVQAASDCGVAIRVGVNAGSLEKDLLDKYGGPTAQALVDSALRNVSYLEALGFDAIKVSLKSSDVPTMIAAYRGISKKIRYPLHLGVTEAGALADATIKSSVGMGVLLNEGIGDTIRVSVTGDPLCEVDIAYGILRSLGIRKVGAEIISCPTCGRCEIDLFLLAAKVGKALRGVKPYIKVALMGCIVNGPGEAREADIGIAGGKGQGLLFKKGKVVGKVKEKDFVRVLKDEIQQMLHAKEV
ncbi:MAG: flavodoxin-dependent (E)-4-hydroxy-3-methylbut-2-enyl-diphosphate synthase [Smithellaceae bacterium]|nr:flavodoxin-dependent (E)-4-hydroxy-3-methylbut-2-enyl-diphosphate synthase [Smithellaceae bacterium]